MTNYPFLKHWQVEKILNLSTMRVTLEKGVPIEEIMDSVSVLLDVTMRTPICNGTRAKAGFLTEINLGWQFPNYEMINVQE